VKPAAIALRAPLVLASASPRRLELLPDAMQLHADGKDVRHVEFQIVDENGKRVSPDRCNCSVDEVEEKPV